MNQILACLVLVAISILAATVRRPINDALDRLVDLVPMLVLRLARRRLPAADRNELYEDWYADLADRRHDLAGRPLAQLCCCTRDALGWLRSGPAVAAIYRGVRDDASSEARLRVVREQLGTLCDRGELPWLKRREGLRSLALHLRDLLRLPPLAFTPAERAQLVSAAAVTAKLCIDDRDECLGQELTNAARPYADGLDPNHRVVLQLEHTTGYAALQLGDHGHAGRILDDVHGRLAVTVGPHHPATLEAQRLGAWNRQERGELDDAEQRLVTILRAIEEASDTDPAQRLHVKCMLGWVQCQQALRHKRHGLEKRAEHRFDESEATYREVIDGRETHLGPDHHDTLDARHSLGKMFFERGDCSRAHDLLRQVADDRERCTDSAHPDTLESRKYAALAAARLGRRREAIAELRRVLATQIRVQGSSHPNAVDTRRRFDTLTQETT
jgi:hypothetical protein